VIVVQRDEREVPTRRLAILEPWRSVHRVAAAVELELLIAARVEPERRAGPRASDERHGLSPDETGRAEDRDAHQGIVSRRPDGWPTGRVRRTWDLSAP
jgi:hypothetical protein